MSKKHWQHWRLGNVKTAMRMLAQGAHVRISATYIRLDVMKMCKNKVERVHGTTRVTEMKLALFCAYVHAILATFYVSSVV